MWILFFLFGCKPAVLEFQVSDSYSGPCVIFVCPDSSNLNQDNIVVIKDGLAKTDHGYKTDEFVFTSIEEKKKIDIIQIGQENNSSNDVRYIFRLTRGSKSSYCQEKDLRLILFFVGTKAEYRRWNTTFNDELLFFDSIGVDWCKYYKNIGCSTGQ